MRAHGKTFDGWTVLAEPAYLTQKLVDPCKTGRKTHINVISSRTNELITWRCRGWSECKLTASTALSIACSSSITIKRDVLLHVTSRRTRRAIYPDPVRLVIAYQHLFRHSSFSPWRGIVIYQTLSPSLAHALTRAHIGSGHQTTLSAPVA